MLQHCLELSTFRIFAYRHTSTTRGPPADSLYHLGRLVWEVLRLKEALPTKRGTFLQYSSYSFPNRSCSHGSSQNGASKNQRMTRIPVINAMIELVIRMIPTKKRIKPTSCGFRVYRYGPSVTNLLGSSQLELRCGFNVRDPHSLKKSPEEANSPPGMKRDQCRSQKVPQSRIPITTTPSPMIPHPPTRNQTCHERLPGGGGQIRSFGESDVRMSPNTSKRAVLRIIRKM